MIFVHLTWVLLLVEISWHQSCVVSYYLSSKLHILPLVSKFSWWIPCVGTLQNTSISDHIFVYFLMAIIVVTLYVYPMLVHLPIWSWDCSFIFAESYTLFFFFVLKIVQVFRVLDFFFSLSLYVIVLSTKPLFGQFVNHL